MRAAQGSFIDIAGRRDLGGYVSEARALWWPKKRSTYPPGIQSRGQGNTNTSSGCRNGWPSHVAIITLMLFMAFSRVMEVAIILAAFAGRACRRRLVHLVSQRYFGHCIGRFIALAGWLLAAAIVMLLYLSLVGGKAQEDCRAGTPQPDDLWMWRKSCLGAHCCVRPR
jgi:Cu(I)/Ag(I) efflux system membrane protein CusA/SilA